jgi:hypothetical protein
LAKSEAIKKLFPISFICCFVLTGCVKSSLEPDYFTDKISGKEVLRQYAPHEQIFSGASDYYTSLSGNSYKLTEPFVGVNSGDTIEGDIVVHLTEYRDKTEMLFTDIQTQSYLPYTTPSPQTFRAIASDGAFRLQVFIDNQLVRPSRIDFFFPNEEPREEMLLFYGTNTDTTFYWNPIVSMGGPSFGSLFITDQSFASDSGTLGYLGHLRLGDYFLSSGDIIISCDYFFTSGLSLTNILVRTSSETNLTPFGTSVGLLFQTENAYLSGFWNNIGTIVVTGFSFPMYLQE